MTIEELEAKEARLWKELKALSDPVDAKRAEWAECSREITRLREREAIKAEVRAELAAEQKGEK